MADMQALIQKGTEVTGFDPRKFSKRTIRILLLGGLTTFVMWNWHADIKSMLADSVDIIKLGIYALLYLAVFGVIWNQMGHFSDFMSRKCLAWWIEYNPWVLQYKEIDVAEANWNKTVEKKEHIAGKFVEINTKILKAQSDNEVAKNAEKILGKELLRTDLTKEGRLLKEQCLQDEQQKQVDNIQYCKTLVPLRDSMKQIIEIINSSDIVMKHKVVRMKRSLATLKDSYETASEGAAALTSLKQALAGDKKVTDEAELSRMKVVQDIALYIGQMTTSMEIINEITTDANLQDAARLETARQQLSELGITSDSGAIPIDSYQNVNFKQIATVSDTRFSMPD